MSGVVHAAMKPAFVAERVTLRDGRKALIRVATPDDAAILLSFMQRCLPDFEQYVGAYADEFAMTVEQERDWLAKRCDSPGSLVLLAIVDECVVAMIGCETNDGRRRTAGVGMIGMSSDKAYWGSGLGSMMMGRFVAWAEANPALRLLQLSVYADNDRAKRLYIGHGFVPAGTVPGRAEFDDGTARDDLVMFRRVDGTLSGRPRPGDFHQDLGDGVVLRQLRYTDAPQLFDLYVRNRERLRPYFRWPMTVTSVGQVYGAIAELYDLFASEQRVNAAFEEDGRLLGLAFFNGNHDPVNRRTELGYWIDGEAEGRGLVTRGCAALVRYAFEELDMNRVDITIDTTNQRSLAIPERLGFTREAVLAQWLRMPDGRMADMANYRLLRQDWEIKR